MSTRGKVALGLIAGGIAVAVSGELLGVFSPAEEIDTITDVVVTAAAGTYGLALLPVLGVLAWAAWHFVTSYRDHRK